MFIKMNQKGFTLVEILVVITLILIIAGIALPRFAGVSDEGRRARAAGELKTLQTALDAYLLENDIPTTWAELEADLEGATPRLIGDVNSFNDPFVAGGATKYLYKQAGDFYVIHSVGPDDTADIASINGVSGDITGGPDDDIFVTNGQYAAAP